MSVVLLAQKVFNINITTTLEALANNVADAELKIDAMTDSRPEAVAGVGGAADVVIVCAKARVEKVC